MKELYKTVGNWTLTAEPNEDREGMNVYLTHFGSGDTASLACADTEGETADGLRIPKVVIAAAWKWIDDENIDY